MSKGARNRAARRQLVLTQPTEKQAMFLASKAKHVGYGGARGGGKSHIVRDKAKRLCLRYPGIKVLIVRRTMPELRANHINVLKKDIPVSIARYNQAERTFFWANGSTIKCDYCDNDGHLMHFQGCEYDVIFLEEATNLLQSWIEAIVVCCRGVNNFPKRIYYTFNPGGPSHGYLKRLFIDRKFQNDESPDDYIFIQAKVTDNVFLMESQAQSMQVAAQKTQEMISNAIQSGTHRPDETGIVSQAPSVSKFDYKNATPAQRKALKEEIRRAAAEGRKIYPG